jgi:cytochrome P450
MPRMFAAPMGDRALDPFPWYRAMRADVPVARDPERGSVSAFRFDDVARVLSDHATFSSQRGPRGEAPRRALGASIISTDPPRHRELRGLVTQAFTPRAVAQLAPRIADIVRELVDAVAPHGRMDVVDDLAYPLPVTVIAELLGVPVEDRARFKRWSDAVVAVGRGARAEADPHGEMEDYFRRTIALRRERPSDDLISALLAAQIDGEQLSELELLGFCTLLLVAGNETTTNLIGNAILCLDEHPDAQERLRASPDLLPAAIEEVLRYRSPVQAMFRTAAVDTRLGDQPVRAGDFVIAWIGSANRDEAQFPEPDRFDVERAPNRHLAFGQGIHFCLGAPLARLEAQIALGALLQRLGPLRRTPEVALEPLGGIVVFGVRHLPIEFAAR